MVRTKHYHPDATIALMTRSSVTLYFATPSFSEVLEQAPGIHRVTSSKEIIGEEVTGAVLGTTAKVAAKPGLTKAVVDALGEACGIIAHDPARAAALYLKSEASKLTPAQVEAILRQMGKPIRHRAVRDHGIRYFHGQAERAEIAPTRWENAF